MFSDHPAALPQQDDSVSQRVTDLEAAVAELVAQAELNRELEARVARLEETIGLTPPEEAEPTSLDTSEWETVASDTGDFTYALAPDWLVQSDDDDGLYIYLPESAQYLHHFRDVPVEQFNEALESESSRRDFAENFWDGVELVEIKWLEERQFLDQTALAWDIVYKDDDGAYTREYSVLYPCQEEYACVVILGQFGSTREMTAEDWALIEKFAERVSFGAVTLIPTSMRTCPARECESVEFLPKGRHIDVIAQSEDGAWYQLASGEWIAASSVINAPADLPVAIAESAPIPDSPAVTESEAITETAAITESIALTDSTAITDSAAITGSAVITGSSPITDSSTVTTTTTITESVPATATTPLTVTSVITVKVATHTPLSGPQAMLGEAVRNGAELAIEQLGSVLTEMSVAIELVPYDDEANRDVGLAHAQEIVADPAILCMVGNLNSAVLLPSMDTYHNAQLAVVAPSTTDPMVTETGYAEMNRVLGRNDIQGKVAQQWAAEQGDIETVFLIHDNSTYGTGIADAFIHAVEESDMQIVQVVGTTEMENFTDLVTQVITAEPDLVYFAGIYDQAGVFFRQAHDAGVDALFMGPDAMDSPDLVSLAGSGAVGLVYTSIAAPISAYEGSEDFVEDYQNRFNLYPEPFAAEGYDATGICLDGIARAIAANNGELATRAQVAEAVRTTVDFPGVTGTITFNEIGDRLDANYFFWELQSSNPAEWSENTLVATLKAD